MNERLERRRDGRGEDIGRLIWRVCLGLIAGKRFLGEGWHWKTGAKARREVNAQANNARLVSIVNNDLFTIS